jgi:SOS-response transcriptional repressor LexA
MKKQHRAILSFIVDFHVINGFYPTMREICDGVPISSTSVVRYHLNKMTALGYVTTRPGRARGISLTDKAFTLLEISPTKNIISADEDHNLLQEVQRLQMQMDSLKRLHQAQIAAYEKERERLIGELSRLQVGQ